MIDLWLIFKLIVPFVKVLLHTYKDYLREEDNHHGRVRKIGEEDGYDDEPNGPDFQDLNNWVGGQGVEDAGLSQQKLNDLKLNLVSRREDVQVLFFNIFCD